MASKKAMAVEESAYLDADETPLMAMAPPVTFIGEPSLNIIDDVI